jgi:hypothetical protein
MTKQPHTHTTPEYAGQVYIGGIRNRIRKAKGKRAALRFARGVVIGAGDIVRHEMMKQAGTAVKRGYLAPRRGLAARPRGGSCRTGRSWASITALLGRC